MDIKEYFKNLRFDERHHLGLGDIRLTMGQQEEIEAAFEKQNAVALSKLNDVVIKPCPFCGGEAEVYGRDFPPLSTLYGVICNQCDCLCDHRATTKEKAIAKWNKRAL